MKDVEKSILVQGLPLWAMCILNLIQITVFYLATKFYGYQTIERKLAFIYIKDPNFKDMRSFGRRLSYMLIHDDLNHLLNNLAAQIVFGLLMSFSMKKYSLTTGLVAFFKVISVFIMSVVMGSFSFVRYLDDQNPKTPVALIGSSAGICGLNGMVVVEALVFTLPMIWTCPDKKVLPNWKIGILALRIIVVICVLVQDLVELIQNEEYICTAIVHIGGMLFGMILTFLISMAEAAIGLMKTMTEDFTLKGNLNQVTSTYVKMPI